MNAHVRTDETCATVIEITDGIDENNSVFLRYWPLFDRDDLLRGVYLSDIIVDEVPHTKPDALIALVGKDAADKILADGEGMAWDDLAARCGW